MPNRLVALLIILFTAAPAGAFSLDDLAHRIPGRAMRASSADPDWQNGNADFRSIEPGETLTVAELDGPGRITHIWFTINARDSQYPRSLVLRLYWDGREEPAVEAPLGDFFGMGHGLVRWLETEVVQISSEGRAYNCYWPMPFRDSARITVTNEADVRVNSFYYYIDWLQFDDLPANTPYFHARYRQEFPAVSGRDYLLADIEGEGHYVGTVLSVILAEKGWFGEGDDRFYIDGEGTPSLRGTGTEDYFSDAWGFREFAHPFHGVPIWEGYEPGNRGTAYRWHVHDPIPFQRSLRVTIEHKGSRHGPDGAVTTGFTERSDYYSSVALWYQVGKPKLFGYLPPLEERHLPELIQELEAFAPQVEPPAGVDFTVQDLAQASQGQQLFFLPAEGVEDVSITVPFEWPAYESAQPGILRLDVIRSFDYGIYDIYLDGERVREGIDLYNPDIAHAGLLLGQRDLEPGEHVLTFHLVGRNPRSKGAFLGVDRLAMTLFPAEATAGALDRPATE